MKKILAAFDGFHFSHSTLSYSIELAKKQKAHLVGVFLEDYAYHNYKIYDLISEEGGGLDTRRRYLDKKDEKKRAAAVEFFRTACENAGLSYSVHKDRHAAFDDLVKESLYGDLLVIDRGEALSHHRENAPTRFIRHLLPDLQSPVLLASSKYRSVEKLLLLYDGEPSAMHAIKMLVYTMPHLCKLPAAIITAGTGKQSADDTVMFKEFVRLHLPGADFVRLDGDEEEMVMSYLGQCEESTLVVLGAYRKKLSRWFRASLTDTVMSGTDFPIFIAPAR